MKKQDFIKLRGIVKNYSDKRDKVYGQAARMRQDVKDGKTNACIANDRIHQLHKKLSNCREREAFTQEAKKIHNDPIFEKHFRSATMEYFLKIRIKPEDL